MILACASCGAKSAPVPTGLLARVAMAGCGKCGSSDIDFADGVTAAFPQPSEEKKRKSYEDQQAEMAKNKDNVTQRMIEKYKEEPDRAYAEEFWGEILRERGVDTSKLSAKTIDDEDEEIKRAVQKGVDKMKRHRTELGLMNTAADDSSLGTGFMATLRALIAYIKHGGDADRIPSWFPKNLLLPQEIKTGRWVSSGDMSLASLQTEAGGVVVPIRIQPKGDPWQFLQDELGSYSVQNLEQIGDGIWTGNLIVPEDKVDDAKSLSMAAMNTTAAKWYEVDVLGKQMLGSPGSVITKIVPTGDYLINGPVGDGWYVPSENRYAVNDFVITVKYADGHEGTLGKSYQWLAAQQANPGAKVTSTIKKAAWGIFNSTDHKMVYGPTTRDAIEMALDSGRYASGYYVGTLPDHPGTEWAPPPEFNREDPFSDSFGFSPYAVKHAKVTEIAKGIVASNPSIAPAEAKRIAKKAVQQYPTIVRSAIMNEQEYGAQLGRDDAVNGRPRDPMMKGNYGYDAAYTRWSEKAGADQ